MQMVLSLVVFEKIKSIKFLFNNTENIFENGFLIEMN